MVNGAVSSAKPKHPEKLEIYISMLQQGFHVDLGPGLLANVERKRKTATTWPSCAGSPSNLTLREGLLSLYTTSFMVKNSGYAAAATPDGRHQCAQKPALNLGTS